MLRRSSWVAVEREALWMLLFNPKFCHTKPNFLNSFLNNYPIVHTSLPSLSILFQPNYTAAIRYCSSQSNSHSSSIPKTTRKQSKHMADTPQPHQNPHQQQQQQQPPNVTTTVNPNVNRMQQLLQGSSSGGWERCWDEGLTPWDLGQPTPVVVHLHRTGALPKGRVLVPGCGSGYDVVAIACPERYVVGLEISDKAITRAIGLASASPNADYCTFLKADFFSWQPTELFDVIFDYTFFCAIEPDMRSAWASRIRDLLKPDGELITLMFPISDHVGGPPYKASVADYEDVLHPVGFEAVSIVENELAIGRRKGREKVGRWKKLIDQSSL